MKEDDESDDEIYSNNLSISSIKSPVKEQRGRQPVTDNLTIKSTAYREKDSPSPVRANGKEPLKPLGDKKFLDNEMRIESQASLMDNEHAEASADDDFIYLRACLADNSAKWQVCHASENLKVE